MDIKNIKQIYRFSAEKNQKLIEERSISFEEVIEALDSGNVLDVTDHPNIKKYPKQRIYVVQVKGYVYAVPFIRQDKERVFLKTIFPSRKLTKKYL